MKSSPKVPSIIRYLLITFIVLIVLVGYYWFSYIPFRENYFTNRNLRLLSDMSENITQVIESYQGQLDKNFINRENSIFQMIVEQGHVEPRELFRSLRRDKCLSQSMTDDFMQNQLRRIRYLSYEGGSVCLGTERFDSVKTQRSRIDYYLGLENDGYLIHMNYLGKRLPREKMRVGRSDTDTYTVELKMAANLGDIMAPLVKPDIFDNILLVEHAQDESDNRVIYQTDRTAFRANRLDSLTTNLKETWSSYHEEVVWGNNAYKLFVQPVRLALMGQEGQTGTKVMEWMLVGLVDSSRLNAEARAISRFFIAQWTFVFFLVLFSIPLIKLNFIGEREELKRSDIVLTIFSIFVLSGVLTFWLLSYYSDRSDLQELDGGLQPLADNIEGNLYGEVGQCIRQFDQLNQKFTLDQLNRREGIVGRGEGSRTLMDTLSLSGYTIPEIFHSDRQIFTSAEINEQAYPYFKYFAWIDSNGMQTRKLSALQEVTPLVNVGHRQYFRKILERRPWTVDGRPFYIEPIISITTGENIAVLSIPDTVSEEPVCMMTLNFMSLVNPVLPKGTGFCIVNKEGLVLFHSSQKKNMRENFFVESSDPAALSAAVFSNVEKAMTVDYLGREHRLHIRPLEHIPSWTLITFADLWMVRSSELNAMSSALSLYTLIVLSFLAVLLLYLLFRYATILNWFWPRKESDDRYRFYSIILFGVAGFYYYLVFHLYPNVTLVLAFLLPVLTAILTAAFFRRALPEQRTTLSRFDFLNVVEGRFPTVVMAAVISLGVLFLVGWHFWAYGVLGLTIGLLLNHEPVTTWISTKKFPNYYARFAFCGVAFFLLTSILPAVALFKMSYDAEKETLVKSGQHSLLQGIQSRNTRIAAELDERVMTAANRTHFLSQRLALEGNSDVYHKFFYGTSFDQNSAGLKPVETPGSFSGLLKPDLPANTPANELIAGYTQVKSTRVDVLLGFLRGQARIVDFQNWELHSEQVVGSSWSWRRWLASAASFLLLSSPGLNIFSYFFPLTEPMNLLWILGMIGNLLLLYFLMTNFIHKVFGISLSVPVVSREGANTLPRINQNTIYIGQPHLGKSRIIQSIEDEYLSIDLRELSSPGELINQVRDFEGAGTDQRLIVLDHFDSRFDELEWNFHLLKLLEGLFNKEDKLVMLITTSDPTLVLPRLPGIQAARQAQVASAVEKEETPPVVVVDKNYLNRWTMVLSSFTKVYHRIHSEDETFVKTVENLYPAVTQAKGKEWALVRVLLEECRPTGFLQNVGLEILTKFDVQRDFINDDVLVEEIRLRSEAYYQSIWSTCSIDEKITLIHLARNGFVPHKDALVVRLLMRKGLVNSEQYRLLNRSFAEFVLTAEKSSVIRAWKRNQESSWDDIRTPLITVVLLIVAFIFITQRQLFNVSIAWITTFAALIPAFFRIISIVRPRLGGGRKGPIPVNEELLAD